MNYQIIQNYRYSNEYIGFGSFSRVYKGNNIKTGEPVAIKEINLARVNCDMNRVKSEIEVLKKLNHPNIVKLYDVIYTSKHVYMVMEYCEKGDLADYMKAKNKPFKEFFAQYYTKQLADGLQYLITNKILHRDIKPQNLLLTKNNILKITDFGFAKNFEPNTLLETLCGTPLYMAPEIAQNKEYVYNSDLWSVGCILYEMLYGKPPFYETTHIKLIKLINEKQVEFPEKFLVSDKAKTLIKKLLQKNPSDRCNWQDFFSDPWLNTPEIIEFVHKMKSRLSESKNIKQTNNNNVTNCFLEMVNMSPINVNYLRELEENKYLHSDILDTSKQSLFSSPKKPTSFLDYCDVNKKSNVEYSVHNEPTIFEFDEDISQTIKRSITRSNLSNSLNNSNVTPINTNSVKIQQSANELFDNTRKLVSSPPSSDSFMEYHRQSKPVSIPKDKKNNQASRNEVLDSNFNSQKMFQTLSPDEYVVVQPNKEYIHSDRLYNPDNVYSFREYMTRSISYLSNLITNHQTL